MTPGFERIYRSTQDFLDTVKTPAQVWAWFEDRGFERGEIKVIVKELCSMKDVRIESLFIIGFVVGWQANVDRIAESSKGEN